MTFYDFPPMTQYAQLLVKDENIVDPVIEVHSLKPDISLIFQVRFASYPPILPSRFIELVHAG